MAAFIKPNAILASGDMSGNVTSHEVNLQGYSLIYFTAVWTGTPTGNIIVESSGDGGTTWAQFASQAAGGAAGDFTWDIVSALHFWRVRYAFTSGAGTLDVYSGAKE